MSLAMGSFLVLRIDSHGRLLRFGGGNFSYFPCQDELSVAVNFWLTRRHFFKGDKVVLGRGWYV